MNRFMAALEGCRVDPSMDMAVIAATLYGCDVTQLDDPAYIEQTIQEAVRAGGFTLIHCYVHQFSPQGVTGSAVLAESHIALHSWPEYGTLFVDVATCSGMDRTRAAFDLICKRFAPSRIENVKTTK